ncbi:MAG: hypothetical protein V2J24_15055 [Pseudomonadales bacterium]|nr:hypothetical protein [Pseudomonadales bacterium]
MTGNGWFGKLTAAGIARPARYLGVTRRHLGALRLLLGVFTAALLLAGPAYFAVAAGLYLGGFLLAHGEAQLAGLSDEPDAAADRFAFLGNVTSNVLAFACLGVGLQLSGDPFQLSDPGLPAPLMLGSLAALAVAVLPWLVQRLEVIDGRPSPEFDGVLGFDGGDIAALVPIALWAGWQEGLLVVVAFGGLAFAGGIYMAHFRKFHGLTGR